MKINYSKQQNRLILKKLFTTFFLLSMLISCGGKNQPASFTRIIERGYVSVGTLYGPNSFYQQGNEIEINGIETQGFAGFEYELAKKYADYLNVELKIVPSYSLDELFMKLNTGEVDVLAAGLSVTDKRLSGFRFAPSYEEVSQKLVFKQGKVRPRKISDLTGELMITASSSHVENLTTLKQVHPELNWTETTEFDSEELLIKLLDDEIDYTIIDSNTLALNRRYYPEISVGFTIKKAEPLAWMVSKNSDDAILSSLVEFFGQVHHDGTLLALDDKYYGHVEQFDYVETRTFIKAVNTQLPQYKQLFEKYGQDINWRLLAAISYQESHWNPHARSYTGVRGMMMLTMATAKELGIVSRLDPEQSIKGGAQYLTGLLKRIPDRITYPDRLWFALASYNVGMGHLEDARVLTDRQGANPDMWVDVKIRLLQLRQKKYYKTVRYGYARGNEPVSYVQNIRRFYDVLVWNDSPKTKIALEDNNIQFDPNFYVEYQEVKTE